MATPLNKPVHRQVELKDGRYLASLDPANGEPAFTLRKARTSDLTKIQMEKCLDLVISGHKKNSSSREQLVEDMRSKIGVADIEYKLKVELLEVLEDILAVDRNSITNESN